MMDSRQYTPRSRFSSSLGASTIGTPGRRTPGTPLSARKTIDRSTRSSSTLLYSNSNAMGTPKNIFRASMSGERARQSFTPRASSSLRQVQTPAPPSTSRFMRSSTGPSNSTAALRVVSSGELFHQTIDDPPSSLDGEALVRQVPDNPDRQGSIYADEFLAHTCPPGLDEAGRRQWFCILDLRRLKYAANELFAKKDWKINIMNFAKEYEKSRGLIMLRYGLYEFQTVKPTDEQMRKWRKDHDIPEPEEETTPIRRPQNGASKRKADSDMPLSDSTANAPKRHQTEPEHPLKQGKRYATDDDENQPSKFQKNDAPSLSLSAFMKAASGTGLSQPLANKSSSNPFVSKPITSTDAKSVLSDPTAVSTSPNIFEHLSDTSRAPSIDNGNGRADSGTDSEGGDTDGKDGSEPSGGVGTPAEGREGTPSLFDRVTRDKHGQPVRVLGGSGDVDTPKQSAFSPANQTWTPNNSIKFANSANNPFGSKSAESTSNEPAPFKPMFAPKKVNDEKPATLSSEIKLSETQSEPISSGLFGSAAAKTAESASAEHADTIHSSNLFKSSNNSAIVNESSKSGSNLFGPNAIPQPSSSTSSNLFGQAPQANGTKLAETTPLVTNGSAIGSSALFGSMPTESLEQPKAALFGSKPTEASEEPKTSLFDPKETEPADKAKPATSLFNGSSSTIEGSKSLFGAGTMSSAPSSTSLFGVAPTAASTEDKTKPMFGSTPASTEASNKRSLFGSGSESSEPLAKKPFGSSADDQPKSGLFGTSSTDDKPNTSMFGAENTSSSNIFGNSNTSSTNTFGNGTSSESKPAFSFGANISTPASAPAADKPVFSFGASSSNSSTLFGAEKKTEVAPASSFFGTSTVNQPTSNLFGSSNTSFGASDQASAPSTQSFSFNSGGTGSNPFAPSTGATNVNFNFAAGTGSSSAPFTFGGSGSNSTPQGSFSFGASTPGTPPATAAPTFSFTGATPSGDNNIFAPQANSLTAAGGTSTGTSSPFNLGGASSLATTPEPTNTADEGSSKAPDTKKPVEDTEEGEEKQAQLNLTEGGPGEEDEEVLHQVKCKALKEELERVSDSDKEKTAKTKSAWSTKGVGPLRLLKHKITGTVRLILRAEPRGNIVVNSIPIPNMPYSTKGKYCIAPFVSESGGLEKWMLMVKTPEAAKALADAINKHKVEKHATSE